MNKITKKDMFYGEWESYSVLFSVIPLFSNTLVRGMILISIWRIEQVKRSLYTWRFFFRDYIMNKILILVMEPFVLLGYFLIIPALIRLCGVPIVITCIRFSYLCVQE